MVNNRFQGALPKGATEKETEVFRQTGITTTKIQRPKAVKKVKRKKVSKSRFPQFRKKRLVEKRRTIPRVRQISERQVSRTLTERRRATAEKILNSFASPIAKARARRILGV